MSNALSLPPVMPFRWACAYGEDRIGLWQDVYRPSTPAGDVYLKLTVIDDVLIVSFKEL